MPTVAAVAVEESKPGYLTTEFWLVIVANVLTQLDVVDLPDKYHGLVLLATIVGYSISRGLAKLNVPSPIVATKKRS